MTNDDLTALAAECEARAKAGEKPVMEWDTHGSGSHVRSYPISTGPCPIKSIRSYRTEYCIDDLFAGDRTGKGRMFSSLAAAQLFVDAILAHATAPLHAARIAALEARIAELEPKEWSHANVLACLATLLDGFADKGATLELAGELNKAFPNVDVSECTEFLGKIARVKELESQLAAPRLRPTAEAPRDGTVFLAWHVKYGCWEILEWDIACDCLRSTANIVREHSDNILTTEADYSGWLPLPAPEAAR